MSNDNNNVTISAAQAAALLSALNSIVAQLVLLNEEFAKHRVVEISGRVKVQS